jgi:hypothetical protein
MIRSQQIHWVQEVRSGLFDWYDYGSEELNKEHYGRKTPPLHDVSRIQVDTVLIYGGKDTLGDSEDVQYLVRNIPTDVLIEATCATNFGHGDFLFAEDACEVIYKPVIALLDRRLHGRHN